MTTIYDKQPDGWRYVRTDETPVEKSVSVNGCGCPRCMRFRQMRERKLGVQPVMADERAPKSQQNA